MNKLIFKFDNGSSVVCADPLKIRREWLANFPTWKADLDLIESWAQLGDACPAEMVSDAAAAEGRTLAAFRKATGMIEVQPDGSGVPESHLRDVYNQFFLFLGDLEKKAETSPSSQPNSGQPVSI